MKNVGSIFLIKKDIVTVGQENLNLLNLCRFKIFEDIWPALRKGISSINGYKFANSDNFSKILNIDLKF